ncbi:MAG: transcriptional regulator [Caulobacter sp.]|nr:transcriptional regulator [Caulobacter sp.]
MYGSLAPDRMLCEDLSGIRWGRGVDDGQDIASKDSRLIADRVREELARRRMSRLKLADSARISLSTLEKALSGGRPFTLGTLLRIEAALGVSLRPVAAAPPAPGLAPETQRGQVSISHESGHIYLITSEEGQFRLVLLSRPTRGGVLFGLLTTLHAGRGAQLTPASSIIAYVPADRLPDLPMGRLSPADPAFESAQAFLSRVAGEDYAQLFPG